MIKEDILKEYIKKKRELENNYLYQVRKLDEQFAEKLRVKLDEEEALMSLNKKEIAEAELEYWKTHSVERFISSIQTSTRSSSTLKKNLRAFFSYYWKRTRVCSFSDLLSLTEDQYSTFANSWAHTSSLVGAKSFEFLKDQIIARGFKFSDEVVVSLVETPSETHYWQTHYYGFHIESIEEEV